jgi:hypothetical protein
VAVQGGEKASWLLHVNNAPVTDVRRYWDGVRQQKDLQKMEDHRTRLLSFWLSDIESISLLCGVAQIADVVHAESLFRIQTRPTEEFLFK